MNTVALQLLSIAFVVGVGPIIVLLLALRKGSL
jgi:hypothetical protein